MSKIFWFSCFSQSNLQHCTCLLVVHELFCEFYIADILIDEDALSLDFGLHPCPTSRKRIALSPQPNLVLWFGKPHRSTSHFVETIWTIISHQFLKSYSRKPFKLINYVTSDAYSHVSSADSKMTDCRRCVYFQRCVGS